MTSSLERLSFNTEGPKTALLRETERLHIERYKFAAKFASGARVLDIACGVGYGSVILKDAGAESVVGVDISRDAIEEAIANNQRDGVCFFQSDYAKISDGHSALAEAYAKTFDVIVSLETIEHIPDPAHFLEVMAQGLRSGGILVGSVPVTPSMDANPYHLHDFSSRSFRTIIAKAGFCLLDSFIQRQPFNPITVRKQMERDSRSDFRTNLSAYYILHPSKLLLRVWSTLRHGFVNKVETVAAKYERNAD